MKKKTIFSIIEDLHCEINIIHFLMDEGYITDQLEAKEGVTLNHLNQIVEDEFGVKKLFSSKKDIKTILDFFIKETKELSKLIKSK